jgi:hypothetical protein
VLLGSQGQTRSSISSIIYSTMEFWFDVPIYQQIGSMLCFGLSSLKLIAEKRNQNTFMKPFSAFPVIDNLTMTQKNNFQEISNSPCLYCTIQLIQYFFSI